MHATYLGRAGFLRAISERIVVFDGAIGTMLQAERLDEAGFRGDLLREHPRPLQGLHDVLSLTRPELVEKVHRRYLAAGADALTTNTFNANAVSLLDYGLDALSKSTAAPRRPRAGSPAPPAGTASCWAPWAPRTAP